jgi:hypothetical protein
LSARNWFAERVDEADRLFAEAAGGAGADLARFPHPLVGPSGEAIAAAAAWLGPAMAERIVCIVSGTHGIEGHAGSPIQCAWFAERGARALPDGTAMLMVHLVNPWGCAWNRRENEDNVDVFRNLVYAERPSPTNLLYRAYEEGINPRAWEGPGRVAADRIWDEFVAEHGMEQVVATIRRGQSEFPKGITYHGKGPSWSWHLVDGIGRRFCRPGARVDVLDIHTGYGPHGDALVASCDPMGTNRDRTLGWFGDRMLELGVDPLIPEHPRGPYHLWESHVGEGRVLNAGLEYGTYDIGAEFELFRANCFIHTYGNPLDAFGLRTSAAYRELFYPKSPAWRDRVLEQGLDAIDVMMKP